MFLGSMCRQSYVKSGGEGNWSFGVGKGGGNHLTPWRVCVEQLSYTDSCIAHLLWVYSRENPIEFNGNYANLTVCRTMVQIEVHLFAFYFLALLGETVDGWATSWAEESLGASGTSLAPFRGLAFSREGF